MDETAVQVTGLRKSYGTNTVLAGLDLAVPKGAVFALLGPNGAGKTTLINILSTLVRPDGGSARVLGHDVVADPDQVRRAISLTGQYAAVDEVLTGTENLVMIGRLYGLRPAAARARARELLADFDLTDAADRRAKSYSGGMRRRLDLAAGLIREPEVIFLDEPTTGLDTRSRQALWRLILALAARGITILLTTQYLEEADVLADRIAVLHGGSVVAEGTATELKRRVGTEVLELHDAEDRVIDTEPVAESAQGAFADLRAAAERLEQRTVADPAGSRLALRSPSLDEVFLSLTSAGAAPPRSRTAEETNR
ncbi:MAG: ATP-binding cassette domain-containing protein [Propionibacteriaceae bacterium]